MKPKKRVKSKPRESYHILLVLLVVVAGVFLLYREISRDTAQKGVILKEGKKPKEEKKPEAPQKVEAAQPKMAIVIDSLGASRKIAKDIFNLKIPLTLSISPHKPYSSWIAEDGSKRGYDIIGHIPMEAKSPQRLGKGGLYTWMKDEEIAKTLREDISSVPHVKGISNHMGSAFTEDKRAMQVLLSVVKKDGLFFLDSLTTSKSVSSDASKTTGATVLRRDIFLDEKDDIVHIKAQWDKALKAAKEKRQAIVLAHARENTLRFLKEAALDTKDIAFVHLSEMAGN